MTQPKLKTARRAVEVLGYHIDGAAETMNSLRDDDASGVAYETMRKIEKLRDQLTDLALELQALDVR